MSYDSIAEGIASELQLTSPPIALSFVVDRPPGVAEFAADVPSSCSFWIQAEKGVFYASAEQHLNCPVGALVMGFELPEAVKTELMGLVEVMCGCEYLGMEEAAKIPAVQKQKKGIVYGPLKDFPLAPDLVLLWMTPRQAMFFSEAAGTASWTQTSLTAATGRPACAALPIAGNEGKPMLSLGCMGMRTFTQIAEDRLLGVLPGDQVEAFLGRLQTTIQANASMASFYQGHKAKFASVA